MKLLHMKVLVTTPIKAEVVKHVAVSLHDTFIMIKLYLAACFAQFELLIFCVEEFLQKPAPYVVLHDTDMLDKALRVWTVASHLSRLSLAAE